MKNFYIFISALLVFFYTNSHAEISFSEMKYVMPAATDFSGKTGGPLPHYKAYKGKELIGICYSSIDITPQIIGYNGPINVLIGLYKTGIISGIKVIRHEENIEEALSIEKRSFDIRFAEKNINDNFIVGEDVDNITGATVTAECISEMVKRSSAIMFRNYFIKEQHGRGRPAAPLSRGKITGHPPLVPSHNDLYIGSSIIFFILFFMALNIRLFFIFKRKKIYFSIITTIEAAGILLYAVYLKSSFNEYYKEYNKGKIIYSYGFAEKETLLNKGTSSEKIGSSEKFISSEREEKSADKEQKEEKVILKPKWGIKKVNESIIKDQIQSGNLSEKEAGYYRK